MLETQSHFQHTKLVYGQSFSPFVTVFHGFRNFFQADHTHFLMYNAGTELPIGAAIW